MKIYKQIFLWHHPDIALVYTALGNSYFELKDIQNAKHYLEKSLSIYKINLPDNHKNIATVYHSLGNYHFYKENYQEAHNCYEQCLRIR